MTGKVFVIAEAGVNHNGSLDLAMKLVDIAADAGADAVKFQTFRADSIVSKTAPKAAYQVRNSGAAESQYQMIRALELDRGAHAALVRRATERGIEFMSTPFDLGSLDFLAGELGLARIKISSGDVSNAPLLLAAARTNKRVILSTGMSTLGDIEAALGVLAFGYLGTAGQPSRDGFRAAYGSDAGRERLRDCVTLLHCTTEYPAPFEDVNLLAIRAMAGAFGLPVGYSDHTVGTAVPIAAVVAGACVIEKHFTSDRTLPGPDHRASIEPEELVEMVQSIRRVELAIGSAVKEPAPSELQNRHVARRSLVAACDIRAGELFTTSNLAVKRPGGGISPMHYWDMLGKRAPQDFAADEWIR